MKLYKKGLKILTRKDSSIVYQPFAIYQDMMFGFIPFRTTFYVKTYNGRYWLTQNGAYTSSNSQEALEVLNKCIEEMNKDFERQYNKQIAHTTVKYF